VHDLISEVALPCFASSCFASQSKIGDDAWTDKQEGYSRRQEQRKYEKVELLEALLRTIDVVLGLWRNGKDQSAMQKRVSKYIRPQDGILCRESTAYVWLKYH
jgi:hypothetical protein